jgi:hypothetical protein
MSKQILKWQANYETSTKNNDYNALSASKLRRTAVNTRNLVLETQRIKRKCRKEITFTIVYTTASPDAQQV